MILLFIIGLNASKVTSMSHVIFLLILCFYGAFAYRNVIVFSLFHYYNAAAVTLSSLYGFPVGPRAVTHRSGRSWALMHFFGHQDLVFNLFKVRLE